MSDEPPVVPCETPVSLLLVLPLSLPVSLSVELLLSLPVSLSVAVLLLPPLSVSVEVLVDESVVVSVVELLDCSCPNHSPAPVTIATTSPPTLTSALVILADRLPLPLVSIGPPRRRDEVRERTGERAADQPHSSPTNPVLLLRAATGRRQGRDASAEG
ncbi:hypothetical protein [Curtobacterium sp. PhB115]|uniref:hypothetical protein n=1 Tax=Curtobacterium sp. PhB115 TaxID=2485173 RepID=UPI00161576E6|nr:hypothetical protein [Curtobacterium sp. PhB115]